jgi:glutamate/tyrosine decarboxylase-like PLP-dependent enzyme
MYTMQKGGYLMEQREIIDRVAAILKEYVSGQKENGFLHFKEPGELGEILHLEDHQDGADWPQIFWWIKKYLEYSARTNHPNFVNRMWAGANLPSLAGEMVVAASNTSSCTFESAPVSTVMEKYMINEMLDLVGFKHGEGQMTTGSSNANMLAMMSARNEMLPEVKSNGLRDVRGETDIYAFVSADAHYSMEKAANILGLGTNRLIRIPVTDTGEMDTAILAEKLESTVAIGGSPFFVGSTAGTTVRGAYDSIAGLLELRRKYPFWLHVDGAWGGAVVVSETLRERYLAGIEDVDSFTWDFHKMLGTALMCNVFLINNRTHTLGKVCSVGDDSYIFHGENNNDVLDLGAVSLQCGRRVDSLKWFLDWKYFGRTGFAAHVERCLELCEYAEKVVRQSAELELVLPRSSFNICFRYKTSEKNANRLNLAIRTKLYHDGISLVGYAYHENRLFLRLLLAGHGLTTNDVDRYFSEFIQTGKTLEGG